MIGPSPAYNAGALETTGQRLAAYFVGTDRRVQQNWEIPPLSDPPFARRICRSQAGGFLSSVEEYRAMQTQCFADLMELVQQGDGSAFQVILDEYGEAIQREVRFTLLDLRLRSCIGESDVFQSVVLRFFSGMREGQYHVETPRDLVGLLKGIARTRVAELARYWRAQRRDVRRNLSLSAIDAEEARDNDRRVVDVLADAELAQAAGDRLSPQDRQILDWRDDGLSWAEIASRLGFMSAGAVRKRHERSLSRIAIEFGSGTSALPN